MRPRTLALPALMLAVAAFCHVSLAEPEKKGRKLALVVGVNEYEGDFTNLSFAVNDAHELANVLRSKRCAFDTVTLLTDKTATKPTAENIRSALAALLKGATKSDTVLVALAGHGVQLEVKDKKGDADPKRYTFFCPKDADLSDVKYNTGNSDSMINLDSLLEQLSLSRPGVKLVLMDACRNELKVKGRTRSLSEANVTVPDGVQALFSCGRKQVAYELDDLKHGLFFHHVLEGLRGKAEVDGEVSWASLTGHVTKSVTRAAKKMGKVQTPAVAGYFEGETPLLARSGEGEDPVPPIRKDDKYIVNSIGMKLVKIPAGEFTMGSPKEEKDRLDDEKQHKVRITKAFYMGIHTVTQKHFKRVMGYNPSYFSKDGKKRDADNKYFDDSLPARGKAKVEDLDTSDFPVENVSWEEAKEFCEKLSALAAEKKEKRLYRLPTEAEWEYSCRGPAGVYKTFHFGDELNGKQANCDGNFPYGTDEKGPYLKRTCKVGSYKANGFGLFDMHGNVWQWCGDWYGEKYYDESPRDDPKGPEEGSSRVLRGGSWSSDGGFCRSAPRQGRPVGPGQQPRVPGRPGSRQISSPFSQGSKPAQPGA